MNIEKLHFEIKVRRLILLQHAAISTCTAVFLSLLPEHRWS